VNQKQRLQRLQRLFFSRRDLRSTETDLFEPP